MKPFFSIIIPSRNSKKTIKNSIDSLKKLNYPKNNFEIIIVDSSEDNTKKILERNKGKNFRIFNNLIKDRRNSNISRNMGAKKARYENLIFLDADCIVSRNWLNDYAKYVNNDVVGGTVVVGGRNLYSRYFNFGLHRVRLSPKSEKIITVDNFHESELPRGANFLIKKTVLRKVNYFDENTPSFDEIELLFRVVNKNYKIIIIPEARVVTEVDNRFGYVIKLSFRQGKGLGYFIMKHFNSKSVEYRLLKFFAADFLTLFYFYFFQRFVPTFILFGLEFIFIYLYYQFFIHRNGPFEILAFIFLDIISLGLVYQFSALSYILKSIFNSIFK